MNDVTTITLFFTLVAGVVLVLLLFRSNRGSGRFRVGNAELRIDFDNSPGFRHPRKRPRVRPNEPPPRYYLHVPGTRWQYPLQDQQVYMGRNADCQIRLRDVRTDSRQAVIYLQNGRYRINNLSSRIPTLVDGRPISSQNLGNGNKIQVGQTLFIFRDRQS